MRVASHLLSLSLPALATAQRAGELMEPLSASKIKKIRESSRVSQKLLFKQPLRYSEDIDLAQVKVELVGAVNEYRVEGTDRSRYISIDAEGCFRRTNGIDGNSDVKEATRRTNF